MHASVTSPLTSMTLSQDEYWQAIQRRDHKADGTFIFAVRSTGIYCRPSCPARRPKRENTLFFPTTALAELAGFRACRRCNPEADFGPDMQLVQRVCQWLIERADGPVTLAMLGQELNLSPYHLQRTFKRIVGVTPHQYLDAIRIHRVKGHLRAEDDVTSAIYDAGFGSSSHFYERATVRLGMTPSSYKRGGRGMSIDYTIVDSPLGRLLVAATEMGICAVMLAETDRQLEGRLLAEFPAAEFRSGSAHSGAWASNIVSSIKGEQQPLVFPLDIDGTAFELQVWAALQAIPYGATRSYGEIARSLSRPGAARAVARACSANPVAVVIPCHRVVRGDGDLGGYRWGVERKAALLRQERLESRR